MVKVNNKSVNDERTWAMLAHLSGFAGLAFPVVGSILGPFFIWQLKGKDYALVDDQGKEALNFQISMLIYFGISVVLILLLVGLLLLPILIIYEFVIMIVAALNANQGNKYRYPLTIRFIK